jgi:hypothetical protein
MMKKIQITEANLPNKLDFKIKDTLPIIAAALGQLSLANTEEVTDSFHAPQQVALQSVAQKLNLYYFLNLTKGPVLRV